MEPDRFLRFAIVGTLGFVVDAGILQWLMGAGGLDPYIARVPSFLAAATTTWLLNRHWTFFDRRSPGRAGEWGRYLVTMLYGGALNYATYASLLASLPVVVRWPVLGVAAGSLVGMIANYLVADRWIFHGNGIPEPGQPSVDQQQ